MSPAVSNDACGGSGAREPHAAANEVARTCATGASNREEYAGSSIDVLQVTAMNGKRSHARSFGEGGFGGWP